MSLRKGIGFCQQSENPYDILAFTLTQKCSAQCEKQVSLFTGGTCFACFNIEGI